MAIKELIEGGSGRVKYTADGASCHREFIGTWDEIGNGAPLVGSAHPDYAFLTVKEVELIPEGPPTAVYPSGQTEYRRMLVDYTFEYVRPKLGDPPSVNYESVSEALLTGHGRTWTDCGDPIDIDDLQTATMYTQIRITVDMATVSLPIETLRGLVNKVNDAQWAGAEAGCVLFEDFTAQAEFDWDSNSWYFRVQFRLLERDRPHNEIWRGPIPIRVNGAIQYYQDDDADGENYKADAALADHPVPKDGTAGTAAWTTTDPLLYESADFTVLGIS